MKDLPFLNKICEPADAEKLVCVTELLPLHLCLLAVRVVRRCCPVILFWGLMFDTPLDWLNSLFSIGNDLKLPCRLAAKNITSIKNPYYYKDSF